MKPDISQQMQDEPPINRAIEDVLAIAGGDEGTEDLLLSLMMNTCVEKLARVSGRARCREVLRHLDNFVRLARPVRPWKD